LNFTNSAESLSARLMVDMRLPLLGRQEKRKTRFIVRLLPSDESTIEVCEHRERDEEEVYAASAPRSC
jgi:hypothetical protein